MTEQKEALMQERILEAMQKGIASYNSYCHTQRELTELLRRLDKDRESGVNIEEEERVAAFARSVSAIIAKGKAECGADDYAYWDKVRRKK